MANIKLLDLLYESLNGARTNYLNKGRIDRTTFEEFNTIDTSKTKKYIEKMCELFVNKIASKEEIIEAFTESIPKIERKLVHFDINKLKTSKDFESFKDNIAFADIKNTKEKRKIVVERGSKQVYKDDRFTILRVDTRDAIKRIGLDTTWCLTYKDDNLNMFYKFPYLYQTSYVIFDNKYPERHSRSKINVQVNKNDSLGEIRTADQTWEGKKNTDVPVEYLEDLGLNIYLFEWTDDKIDYYMENYMFTFKDGLTLDILKKKFPWIFEEGVQLYGVTIGHKDNKLIWYDGDWSKGTWEDGIWKDGRFYVDGIWKDGIFEKGSFGGKWYGGEWKGDFFEGEWLDPNNHKPLNIKEYKDSLTLDIIKDKFSWLFEKDVEIYDAVIGRKGNKLIWYSGNWIKGTWEDGLWLDGDFMEDGIWKGGDWQGGVFEGKWLDPNNPKPLNISEYKDGLTLEIIKKKFPWLLKGIQISYATIGQKGDKLVWYDGIWSKGTWKDGIWKNGKFYADGIWKDGIFEGGYFFGNWYGGEWRGGEITHTAKWLDPNNPRPLSIREYKDSLTLDIIKDKFSWLFEKDVRIYDAVIGRKGNKLIWYSGNWIKGTWEDGLWLDGDFMEDGIWKGGEWKGGFFEGKWLDPNNPKPE